MNTADGTGTRPTRILVICDDTATTSRVLAELWKDDPAVASATVIDRQTFTALMEAGLASGFVTNILIPIEPPKEFPLPYVEKGKRGQYWKNDFDRTFGRRRK